MKIKCIVVGPLKTNCYILEKNDEVLIIDPGSEEEKIISNIDSKKRVVGILITHHHFDHIGSLNILLKYYHTREYNMNNLMEGENTISHFKFNCLYTPGHFYDSICFDFEDYNIMFVGDLIFNNSVGRVDLEGANVFDMINSLNRILTYPNRKIMTGHGDSTTIDDERSNIKYFIENLYN